MLLSPLIRTIKKSLAGERYQLLVDINYGYISKSLNTALSSQKSSIPPFVDPKEVK